MNNKLPLSQILKETWSFCLKDLKPIGIFAFINYIICLAAFYSWKTVYIWPVLIVLYILWGALFRYYFKRQPYVEFKLFVASLVPSTKILFLSILVISFLATIPFLPLFFPKILSAEAFDKYAYFLQNNPQGNEFTNLIINLIVTILSPFIFYRPIFAWISSLIGRSGLLKSAFEKTKGNYWELLLLAIIINLSTSFIYQILLYTGAATWLIILPISLLMLYFNIVLACCYDFFFLQKIRD